ncbi:hypothetical protein LY56_00321 [Roseinatronobacter thiooxidans]|jgi:hypothetical protein|uniref:Uncharacterized protein n=1 Tax=Roseinatronobacter thiooxidans TaxID=121821 RepID=A0A2W7QJ86_9RHOB|nr:hypothetical protein [Roseinatronobacter thiooxidans]PZX48171.1 hypothetical protein LY56_00321 [Roseinatronobacter thiooxidans]
MMQARSPMRLFVMYFISFVAALALCWLILMRLAEGVREGQWMLLLLPPLGGMAVFHGLFPLLSRIRLGLEFIAVGGGLVYGLGAVLTGVVWLGLMDPGTALVFWLAGVFGPGWWIMSQWAEKIGYFK